MDLLNSRDVLAFTLLKDFIKEGFPTPDPEKQVVMAYSYADAILAFKEHEEMITKCKRCGNTELHSTPAGTVENPHQYILMCKKCNWQETHEK